MFGKKKKNIALYTFYALILLISLTGCNANGLTAGCPIYDRLAYPFCHANIFHAAINVYVLNQCINSIKVGFGLLVFYIIAVTYPFANHTPILGLSGIVYSYMGFIAPFARNKVRYNATVIFYIAIGLLFPCIAFGVHLYCYVLGLIYGYLNLPSCEDK